MGTTVTTENNDVVGTIELFYDKNNIPSYKTNYDAVNAIQRWFWDWDQTFLETLKEKNLISKNAHVERKINKNDPNWKPEDCCGNKESCCGGAFDGNGTN